MKEFPEINFEPIPWCQDCYWVKNEERWITKTLNYLLGDFYIQEPASLLAALALNPQVGERVLDLCASPGSKTTQIVQILSQKGTIVANDVNLERVKILITNLRKFGALNMLVTVFDGRDFPKKESFDKVLVDAPCTSVGSDLKSVYKWNKEAVKRLSKLQKELVVSGFELLKPGGTLVYSTCTISVEENEKIVEFLLERFKGKAKLEYFFPKNITFSALLPSTVRIYAYQNGTENFFVAKIRKV